ncbi:MAG: hypothetical protein MR011_06300 [Lachnospiraceae bacterium]|nr:hypothetical protein [Lachnospiraceae bacterium]
MAGIRTSIEITDRITAPLNHMMNALNMTVGAFDKVNEHSHIDLKLGNIQEELSQAGAGFKQLGDEIEKAKNKQNDFNKKANEGVSALANIGTSLMSAIGAYMSFQAVSNTIGHAIDYASDLVEVQNVVDVTFGESSAAIDEWAKTTLDAFGMSELASKRYAGTMGAMLKSMGNTGAAVDEMSVNLTQLAGDLASFYNLDTDTAFDKIRSGISGETEPLKQLGINMSVANLNAYALSQGLTLTYDKMDAASQSVLRYNYLMSVTADAQGDFARTQDSFANQVRLLQGSWENFTGTLATNVLPVLTFIIASLNNFMATLQNNANVLGPILLGVLTILGLYTTALITLTAVKGALAAAEAIHTAFTTAWSVATFTATAAQSGLNAALLACPITWIIMAIVALIALIIAICQWIANATGVASSWFGVMTGGINVIIVGFQNFLSAVGIVCENMAIAFGNSIANIKSFFYSLLATATSVIAQIANKLNALPFVNIDVAGLNAAADSFSAKAQAAQESKKEYKNPGSAFKSGWAKEAFSSGSAWGDGIAKSVSDKISNLGNMAGGGATATYNTGNATLDNIQAGVDNAAGSSGKTASNTSKMVDVSDEQIKYLRDIAEQEAINRFTTAQISVNMTNNNNVSKDMDLDGMISSLTEGVREAMEAAAEGVE